MTNFNDLQTKKSITNVLSHMEQRWRWNAHPFSLTYLQPTYGFDLGTMEDHTEQKIRVITGRPIVRTRQVPFSQKLLLFAGVASLGQRKNLSSTPTYAPF